ncbi:MAG: protein kinase [Clostridia bacterium]|nr:protein kinase [Clostridia bacterium]
MERIKPFEPLFGSWYADSVLSRADDGVWYRAKRTANGAEEYCRIKLVPIPAEKRIVDRLKEEGLDEEGLKAFYDKRMEELNRETGCAKLLHGYANILEYAETALIPREGGEGADMLIRTELLPSLAELTAKAPLDRGEVIDMGAEIATALEACTMEGVVHGAVSPVSVFRAEDGSFRLGGFEKAREKGLGGRPAEPGPYSAPEIYKGEADSERTDIYSLGLIMYRLMNRGRLPLLPNSPEPYTESMMESAAMRRIAGAKLPAPCDADEALSRVILKAVACDPRDRYQSARELRQDLAQLKYSRVPEEEAEADVSEVLTPPAAEEPQPLYETPAPAPEKRGRREKRRAKKEKRAGETPAYVPAEAERVMPLPQDAPPETDGPEFDDGDGRGSKGLKVGIIIASVIAGLALLGILGILVKNVLENAAYEREQNAFHPRPAEIVQDAVDKDVYRVTLYRKAGSVVVYETPAGMKKEYLVGEDNRLTVEIKGSDLMPDEPIDSSSYSAQPRFYEKSGEGELTPIDVGYVMLEVPELNVVLECGDSITTDTGEVRIAGRVDNPGAEVTVNGEGVIPGEGGAFVYEKTWEENGSYPVEVEARLPRHRIWRGTVTVEVAIPEPPMILLPWDMGDTEFSQRVTVQTGEDAAPAEKTVTCKAPEGMSVTLSCEDERVVLTEPEMQEDGTFTFTAALPQEVGDYVINIDCANEAGETGSRVLHLQCAPEWKPYVESAWAMSYDALTRASRQCYNVKGAVTGIIEHHDYYLVTLETADGSTLLLEYHHHYPTANEFVEGKTYSFIYGHPIGKNADGAPVVYVWFVNDK